MCVRLCRTFIGDSTISLLKDHMKLHLHRSFLVFNVHIASVYLHGFDIVYVIKMIISEIIFFSNSEMTVKKNKLRIEFGPDRRHPGL